MELKQIESILKQLFYRIWNVDSVKKISKVPYSTSANLVYVDFYDEFKIEYNNQIHNITQAVIKLYENPEFFNKAEKEVTILNKMHNEGINVPKIYFSKRDLNYYIIIMEKINGMTLLDKLNQETNNEIITQIFENYFIQMIKIHSTDINNFGLYNEFKAPPNNYLAELVKFQYSYNVGDRNHFKGLLNWIETNKQLFLIGKVCVIHNDYHLTNVLINSDNDVFVVDWTNLMIGDPMTDIALAISSASNISVKFSEIKLINIYEKISSKKLNLAKFNFYVVLVWFRRLLYFYILLDEFNNSNSKEKISLHFYLDILNNIAKKITEITGISLPEFLFKLDNN